MISIFQTLFCKSKIVIKIVVEKNQNLKIEKLMTTRSTSLLSKQLHE